MDRFRFAFCFVFLVSILSGGFLAENAFAQNPNPACPKLELVGPSDVIDFDTPTRFYVDGADREHHNYQWSASLPDVIVEGQGTSQIQIVVSKQNNGSNLTVRVKVDGIAKGCSDEVSEVYPIRTALIVDTFSDFGQTNKYQMRARVDNFFILLNDNPRYEGVIIIDYDENESRKEKISRIKMILDAVNFRDYDISRLVFLIAIKPDSLRYDFRVLSPENKLPVSLDDYLMFRGKDLASDINQAFPEK